MTPSTLFALALLLAAAAAYLAAHRFAHRPLAAGPGAAPTAPDVHPHAAAIDRGSFDPHRTGEIVVEDLTTAEDLLDLLETRGFTHLSAEVEGEYRIVIRWR